MNGESWVEFLALEYWQEILIAIQNVDAKSWVEK